MSVLLALLLGFAIQRGGTCTVAALEEVVQHHRWTRLRALLEASMWVLAGVILLRAFDRLPQLPLGYPLHWQAALGGVFLGLGALINGGCAFGVVARIGSGQWAWLATPPGFLLGYAAMLHWFAAVPVMPLAGAEHASLVAASGDHCHWSGIPAAVRLRWSLGLYRRAGGMGCGALHAVGITRLAVAGDVRRRAAGRVVGGPLAAPLAQHENAGTLFFRGAVDGGGLRVSAWRQ